jgi:DNA-directed RNA polymerase specialized sigma24 family protein
MSQAHTITGLLAGVSDGDEKAIEKLVHVYLDRLVGVGRRKYRSLGNIPRPVEDEEDAALSALDTFCGRAREGKIQDLANREQLWALLVKITIRKVYDQRERATAKKRRGKDPPGSAAALDQVISELPGPQAEAELKDTYRAAMDLLTDPDLKRIAEMDLEGRNRAEIAEGLGLTERTVYRKLQVIREHWDRFFANDR